MDLRDWVAAGAVAATPFMSWHGQAWRTHDGLYKADSYGGSLRFSARFHRAPDEFPPNRTWPPPAPCYLDKHTAKASLHLLLVSAMVQ